MSEVFVVGLGRTMGGDSFAAIAEAAQSAGVRLDRLEAVYWSSDAGAGKASGVQVAGIPVVAVRGGLLGSQQAVHLAAQAVLSGDVELGLAGGASPKSRRPGPAETRRLVEELALAEGLDPEGLLGEAGLPALDGGDAAALVLASPAAVGRLNLVPRACLAGRGMAAAEARQWWQGGIAAARVALQRAGIQAADVDLLAFSEPCPGPGRVLASELDLDLAKICPAAGLAGLIPELEGRAGTYALLAGFSAEGLGCATVVQRV